MTVVNQGQAIMLAADFEEEFKDWFSEGATTTVLYIALVLAVIFIVLKATS